MSTSPPRSFTCQPIRYECAYGGTDRSDPDPRKHRIDLRNPVGRGVAVQPNSLVDRPAHCIEYANDDHVPAGFGALASHWSPRHELAGTFDERWRATRHPLLPLDHDARTRQSSPQDQRPGRPLTGGDTLTLRNMNPSGLLTVRLPRVELGYVTHFGAGRRLHHGSLGTVILEPDLRRLYLVWQTALPVRPRDLDDLDATVINQAATP